MEIGPVNRNHPELHEGEIFLGNYSDGDRLDHHLPDLGMVPNLGAFSSILWTTKRRGEQAFDVKGEYLPDFFPVFVQKQELVDAGINIDR